MAKALTTIQIVLHCVSFTMVFCKRNPCLEQGEGIQIRALEIEVLHVAHDESTSFTWQAVRGTTDITIWNSNSLSVTTLDLGEGAYKICAKSSGQCSGAMAISLLKGPSAALTLMSAGLLHSSLHEGQIWTSLLLFGSAAFTLGQATDLCHSVPQEFLHIQIPTNLVKDLCVNGPCTPLLCPMNVGSQFSQIPSNNDIIFSDDNCKIREPEFWDEWLEYHFGEDSGQDYFGDVDNDGLVNILEYYGTLAFEGTFLNVHSNNTRKSVVCNCTEAQEDLRVDIRYNISWTQLLNQSSNPR